MITARKVDGASSPVATRRRGVGSGKGQMGTRFCGVYGVRGQVRTRFRGDTLPLITVDKIGAYSYI